MVNTTKIELKFIFLTIILLLVDAFGLIVSLQIASYLRANIFNDSFPAFYFEDIRSYYWIVLLILIIFVYEKIYFIRYDFWIDTKKIINGLFLAFVTVFVVISLAKISSDYSRSVLILFFLIGSLVVPILKRLQKSLLFKLNFFKLKVKIIANDPEHSVLEKEIKNNWYLGLEKDENTFNMVLISSKNFSINKLQRIIKKYAKKTKDIYIVPYLDNLDLTHASIVNYTNIRLSAVHIENRLLNYKNIIIKEIFEKLLILLLTPFILAVHFLIVLLIKNDSKGSARFKQKRITKDFKTFSCYKYRTMYENSEDLLSEYLKNNPSEVDYYEKYHKYKNDPRITKIGKFLRKTSLDELPQFFNVLRGDMHLIGPRPYMLNEKEKIGIDNQEIIFQVKPGITGLWQVSGRSELSFKERVELDKWYIQNWSLWLDFTIFMKTIKVVFFKVGAK